MNRIAFGLPGGCVRPCRCGAGYMDLSAYGGCPGWQRWSQKVSEYSVFDWENLVGELEAIIGLNTLNIKTVPFEKCHSVFKKLADE